MISKCIDFNKAMSNLRQSFTKQSPQTREDVLQTIDEVFSVYKDHSDNDILEFSQKLKKAIKSLIDKTWIGKLDINTIKNIQKLFADISEEELSNTIAGRSNSASPEAVTGEESSKAAGDVQTQFYTLQKFDDRYGTSIVRSKLLQKVHQSVRTMFFIDDDGYELCTKSQINTSIRNQQQKVYKEAVDYVENRWGIKLPKVLYQGNPNANLNKLIQTLESKLHVTPASLTIASAKNQQEDVEYIQFVNNVSYLQFFDQLLTKDLEGQVKIREGYDGVFSETVDKYELDLTNANMTKTFRDDDKDIDGHAESNGHVKRLETIQKYDIHGNLQPDQLIPSTLLSYVNARLKLFIHSIPEFKTLQVKNGNTLYDLVVKSQYDNMIGYQELYETLYQIIVGDLVIDKQTNKVVHKNNSDNYIAISLNSDITDQDKYVIVSAYKEIFDSNPDSKSLYMSYIRTSASLFKDGADINIQPMNYYGMVVQNLATQEPISQQAYILNDKSVESKTLHARLQEGKTYYIDQMLDAKFSVEVNQNFETFTLGEFYSKEGSNNSNSLDISITSDSTVKYRITKTGTDTGGTFTLYRMNGNVPVEIIDFNSVIKDFSKFFKEVLNINIDEIYLKTLENLHTNYAKDLFKMVSNTLYAYAVSKELYKNKKVKSLSDYKEELKKYYGEKHPTISKSSKQLKYALDTDVPLKIKLAVTKEILNNVLSGNILKDSQGKAISLVGLSQLATRIEQQLQRIQDNSSKKVQVVVDGEVRTLRNSETVNDAVSKFTAKRIYSGVEFTRDYDGGSVQKKATEFSTAEYFYSSFVLDYLNNVGSGKLTKFTPSIISDKSKLIKINMDLNKEVSISSINPKTGQLETRTVPIHKLQTQEIQALAKEELGLYYKRIYEEAAQVFKQLSTNTLGLTFDYKDNFEDFNTKYNAILAADNGGVLPDVKTIIQKKKDFIHSILLNTPNCELVSVLHYSFDKKGNLVGNRLLMDQLHRWGCKVDVNFANYGIGTEDYDGYGTSEEFFKAKELELVSSLIYEDGELRVRDDEGHLMRTVGLQKLAKRTSFMNGENVALAVIKYSYIDSEGNEVEKQLKLSDKDSIVNSYIYKQIRKNRNFEQFKHLGETYNPYSPTFSVESLVEAIKIYNATETLKKEALSKLSEDATKEDKAKAIKKYITAKRLNSKIAKQNVNIEIHPDLQQYQALDYWLSQEYMNMSVGTHLNHPAGGKTLVEQESKAWANQVKRNVSMTAAKHVFAQNVLTGIRPKYRTCVIEDDSDVVSTIHGVTAKQKYTDGATFNCGVTNYLENYSLQGDRAGVNKKQFVHFYKNGYGGIIKTAGFPITNEGLRKSEYLQRMNKITLRGKVYDQNGIVNSNIDITKGFNGDINYGDIYYREIDSEGKSSIIRITELEYTDQGTIAHKQRLTKSSKGWTWVNVESIPIKLTSSYDIWNLFGGYNSMELASGKSDTNPDNYDLSENSFKQLTFAVNYVGTLKSGVKGPATFQTQVHQPLKEALIDYVITEGAIKQGAANVNSTKAYFNDDYEITTMEIDTHDAGIQLNAEHHADGSTLSLMTQVINALTARGYSVKEGSEVYEALKVLVMDALKDYDAKDALGNAIRRSDFVAKVIVKSLTSDKIESEQDLMSSLLKEMQSIYKKGKFIPEEILAAFPFDNPSVLDNAISKISSFLSKSTVRIKFPGSMQVLVPSNKIYKLYQDKLLNAYPDQSKVKSLGFGADIVKSLSSIELGKTYKVILPDGTQQQILVNTPTDYYELCKLNPTSVYEDYSAGRDLASYNLTFTDSEGKLYNLWDIDSIYEMWHQDESLLNPDDRVVYLQKTMEQVQNGATINVRVFNQSTGVFETKKVTINNLNIKPYELICGNVYQTTFGLRVGDDVSDIIKNKRFFLKRALANFKATLSNYNHYDVELKQVNGNHVYLKHLKAGVPKGLTVLDAEIRKVGDDVVQIDSKGKVVRTLSSINDKIYVDANGNQIIATENFDFYLNNTNFVHIGLSNRISNEALLMLENGSKNDQMAKLMQEINATKGDTRTIIEQLNNEIRINLREILKGAQTDVPYLKRIISNCYEIHTSFIKSLDMIASRTPAQCHQSFMAMRIVGFDKSGLNNAYVNKMQLYLQGSDYDIDKVSLLGYVIKRGKFVKWSPYMKLDNVQLLRASENLPFPTGNNAAIVTYNEEQLNSFENLLTECIQEQLFVPNKAGKTVIRLRTEQQINLMGQLIKFINKNGLPDNETLSLKYSAFEILPSVVNRHNNYLDQKTSNKKEAAINFASTKVFQTSLKPANLVQGQISVDEITEIIKKLAVDKPMSERAKKFAPGNVMSKLEQLVLTLGGKENTSLVASALKVFEAISQSYYKALDDYNGEAHELDFLDVKKGGFNLLDKTIYYIANAYSNNPKLTENILGKIASVDNITDAYIYFSGLLSLSTDNAKDPTLTKINAGPQMISLYLAGLALGLDFEVLVKVMTSDFAWEITNMMSDNIFNGTKGLFDIKSVLTYLTTGPVDAYNKLPYQMQKFISNVVYKAMGKQYWDKVPTKKDEKSGDEVDKSLYEITSEDVLRFLSRNSSFNLGEVLSGKSSEDREKIIAKQYNRLQKYLESVKQDRPDLSETQVEEYAQNSSEDVETSDEANSLKVNSKESYVLLKRFLKEVRKHRRFRRLSFIPLHKFDQEYYEDTPYEVISKLQKMAEEMSNVRTLVALNQDLPNNLADLIKFVRKFENILASKISENSNFYKDYGTKTVDLNRYVNDAQYRKDVIEAYELVKDFVNPFRVIENNEHYFGYLKAVQVQYNLLMSNSKVCNVSDKISNIIWKRAKANLEQHLAKVKKFVINKLNNRWLLQITQSGLPGKAPKPVLTPNSKYRIKHVINNDTYIPVRVPSIPLVLGTPSGNATFKHWMDTVVIPQLKADYPQNKLLQDLEPFENSKTNHGNGVIQYGVDFAILPKTDQELKDFDLYKSALSELGSYKIGNYTVQDLLFFYNQIVYNGETVTNSLSNFFADIIANRGVNELVDSYQNFYSEFGKNGKFEEGEQYTEDEVLRYIAPITTVGGLSPVKLKYARVYLSDRMKYVMVRKDKTEASKALEEYTKQQERNDLAQIEIDPELINVNKQGYVIEEEVYNKNYYLHNYVEVSPDVLSFSYNGVNYSEQDLKLIARANGHDVGTDIFVKVQKADGTISLDLTLTRNNIEEIFKKKEC